MLKGKKTGVVSIFEMTNNSDFEIMDFGDDLDNWIDFVCQCRGGSEVFTKYDMIIGKVANDKVFRVVDMYNRGIWDKERAIKEIRAYEVYDQLAFISQEAIDSMINFKGSFMVEI